MRFARGESRGATRRWWRARSKSKIEIDPPIAHHAKNARKMIVGDPSSANPKRAGRAATTTVEPIRRVGESDHRRALDR